MKIPFTHDKFLSNVIVIPKDSVIEFAKIIANKNWEWLMKNEKWKIE